jgi:flagellin
MALSAISNFAAHVAHRNVSGSNKALGLAMAKLAAGRRVLSAKDDAAALAIGSRMGAEVSGLQQAKVNVGQANAVLQVADGGLARTNDIMARMKSLAVQASSGQLGAGERKALNTEFRALASEIDRISADTEFAGTGLLDGSVGTIDIKVGTGTDASADNLSLTLSDSSIAALGMNGVDISSQSGANTAIGAIDHAIGLIQSSRASIGADQNRLNLASVNLATSIENTEAARSSLIDLDVAAGSSDLASKRLLFQSGIAMLEQSNNKPKHVMRLLI